MGNLRDEGTIYDRIRQAFALSLGNDVTDTEIAKKIGITKHLIGKWKKGISRPSYEALAKISELTGRTIDYFITGHIINLHYQDNPIDSATYDITPIYSGKEKPTNSVDIDRSTSGRDSERLDQSLRWPVRGLAAADDTGGSRVPDVDDIDEPIAPPTGITLVPVKGDSMSPLILSGQYAMIDSTREGFEDNGGIVVASILEPDAADERREPMTGTIIKRCYDLGDRYNFVSINNYPPFTAFKDHCRVWPVIGVWFGGMGKAPK